jgi:hypothetical protein
MYNKGMKFIRTLILLTFFSLNIFSKDPSISKFSTYVKHSLVLVSLELEDAFPSEILERVRSGLPLTFTYYFYLKTEGKIKDKVWVKTKVTVTCKYDPVKIEYRLNFRKDDQLFDTKFVHSWSETARLMSSFQNLSLFEVPEEAKGKEIYLSVEVHLLSKTKWLIFPSSISVPETTSAIFKVNE